MISGMYNKSGGKVRLTFKLELDQLWISTKGTGLIRAVDICEESSEGRKESGRKGERKKERRGMNEDREGGKEGRKEGMKGGRDEEREGGMGWVGREKEGRKERR